MVSVIVGSLADRYLTIAHNVVDCLQDEGYNVEYAFFYIRHDENQHWTEGDWWLRLAVDELEHDQKGVNIVNEILRFLDVDILEFDFDLNTPNWEIDKRMFNRIDIKEYSP